jgi:hypothetical protein
MNEFMTLIATRRPTDPENEEFVAHGRRALNKLKETAKRKRVSPMEAYAILQTVRSDVIKYNPPNWGTDPEEACKELEKYAEACKELPESFDEMDVRSIVRSTRDSVNKYKFQSSRLANRIFKHVVQDFFWDMCEPDVKIARVDNEKEQEQDE